MQDFLYGSGVVVFYIIVMASTMILARICIKIPDELFRKILHFVLLGAYIPLINAFKMWWMASLFAAIMIVLLYPVLSLAEKLPVFASFIHQRKDGEIKKSMIFALAVMAVSTAVCWGLFGDRYLVLACVYAWGVGDAFAALVGKQFGKHRIRFKFADKNKSVEGSLAMLISSAIAVWVVLMCRGGIGPVGCFGIAFAASVATMLMELCSKEGYDTFTCPAVAMAVILPLIYLFGG